MQVKHRSVELDGVSKFLSDLAYFSEFALSILLLPFLGYCKRFVFFDGPTCGTFTININLTKKMGLVLLCHLNEQN